MENGNWFQTKNRQFLNIKLRSIRAESIVFNIILVRKLSVCNSFRFHTAYRIIAIPNAFVRLSSNDDLGDRNHIITETA